MSISTPQSLLFVTIANHQVGFGHLNRCLTIAEVAREKGFIPRFCVFGDEGAAACVTEAGFPFRHYPLSYLVQGVTESVDVLIADVVYADFFSDGNLATDLFAALRRSAQTVVAIDSLGENSLAVCAPNLPVDILLVPYAIDSIDKKRLSRVGMQVMAGSKFAIMASSYRSSPRTHRIIADRVLITCGGADPFGWTLVLLQALEEIEIRLSVRVIIGPLFDVVLSTEITKLAATSRHEVSLIIVPERLDADMRWCDLAIAASGLTKYELAATATPAILFSFDALQDLSNRSFAALDVAINLGVAPTVERIAEQTRELLDDQKCRINMADTGRKLIDGKGVERVICEMIGSCDVT